MKLHNAKQSRFIISFSNTQPAVDAVIKHPLVMIASDGAMAHPQRRDLLAHPGAVCKGGRRADFDGCAPEDEPDAGADAWNARSLLAGRKGACRKEQTPTSWFSIRRRSRIARRKQQAFRTQRLA